MQFETPLEGRKRGVFKEFIMLYLETENIGRQKHSFKIYTQAIYKVFDYIMDLIKPSNKIMVKYKLYRGEALKLSLVIL